MTHELTDLARRAVACKGWRWMPGMLIHAGFRCVWVDDETFRSFDQNGNEMYGSTDCLLPDLTDPATLGCVLALYENTRTTLTCPDPVYTYAAAYGLLHPRTVEALVAALEAAP